MMLRNRISKVTNLSTRSLASSARVSVAETFDGPARLRPVHSRPLPVRRELPFVKRRTLLQLGIGLGLISVWGLFLLVSMNEERLASSVVRQILSAIRRYPGAVESLGGNINPELAWYMFGAPHIGGQINLLQGNVDVTFRVRGTKGAGTVYFSSIRKAKGDKFVILRFKLICDDSAVIRIPAEGEVVS